MRTRRAGQGSPAVEDNGSQKGVELREPPMPGRRQKQKATPAKQKAIPATPREIKPIVLERLDLRIIKLKLVGDSPLYMHRFAAKAIKIIQAHQEGGVIQPHGNRDPQAEYEDAFYRDEKGHPCMPGGAFKSSAVSFCTSLKKQLPKTLAKQSHHVMDKLVRIHGDNVMDTANVRIGMGKADLRYRPRFDEWWCEITIKYNARVISAEQLVNLYDGAGFSVGVGDWRVEKGRGANSAGMFHVAVD